MNKIKIGTLNNYCVAGTRAARPQRDDGRSQPPNPGEVHTNEGVIEHWLVSLGALDDQQKYILSLRPEESYMVEGCAGSGKSVLAMIKFNQLCQDGKKPVYATMMRGLTDTIISEVLASGDEGMAAARNYVSGNTVKRNGSVGHGKPWYYSSTCIGTCFMLPCINPQCGRPLKGDFLVLDECQDLSYGDFKKILTHGGFKSICWYGDDDQQLCDTLDDGKKHVRMHEIFEECFPGEESGEKWYQLVWNYRISPNVAKFIDEFQRVVPEKRKPMALSARGRRTDKPYLCGYASFEDEVNSVVDIIRNRGWNENRNTRHTTAILVGGSNQQVESMYALICKKLAAVVGERNIDVERRHGETSSGSDDWVTADPGAAVVVSSPLSSKGCQFDSVFVLANTFGRDGGRHMSPRDLNAIHVAMTRSGGELFVFYVGAMPPAFDQIPLSLYESSVAASTASAEDMGIH